SPPTPHTQVRYSAPGVSAGTVVSDSLGQAWSLISWGLPLLRQALRQVNLGRGHLSGETITKITCLLVTVRCCQAVPHVGLDIVLEHALSLVIQHTQAVLRIH